ncbi:hypothetical protein KQX54_009077 [Cotesia glomerata]|uniref:Uncharacterized protein n=1 Tax=Cotesia glomerata TaxID=32391 RepID=A0AAV7ICP3_COTGL|nr:hypothetical protein KQX54_009077 [Cotesia glomerata]
MSGFKYLCVLLALSWIGVTSARLNCDAVRTIFESHGFPFSDIPKDPISWISTLRDATGTLSLLFVLRNDVHYPGSNNAQPEIEREMDRVKGDGVQMENAIPGGVVDSI